MTTPQSTRRLVHQHLQPKGGTLTQLALTVRKCASSQTPCTLQTAQWIGIRYGPSGSAAQGGDATLTSYGAKDGPGGLQVGQPIGTPHVETDFEYNMYVEANDRHNSLSAADQARSSPSGWYELLRFGRNLGPDPLPANAAHWRPIPTDTGHVWADLNAPGTFKFSDADFPAFRGWQCFDDDTSPLDQRCDSVELRRLIRDPALPETIRQPDVLAKRLSVPEVRAKLQYAICKFPTEWDKATITRRYEWLKTDEEFRMSEGHGWEEFAAHCEALCPDELPQEYKDADWHLHPKRLIQVFRQCEWLSVNDFAQSLPRKSFKYAFNPFLAMPLIINWQVASHRASVYTIDLRKTIRKYSISTKNRFAHFIGQTFIETDIWRTMREIGEGRPNRAGNWAAPPMKYYTVFYGRGMMQLTWPANYESYLNFRTKASLPENFTANYADRFGRITSTSEHYWFNPNEGGALRKWFPRYDPDRISNETFNSCDSAGWYWVSKNIGNRQKNINKVCDNGVNTASIGRVSVLVNGGGYGYFERQAYVRFIERYVSDEELSTDELRLNIVKGAVSAQIVIDNNFQRP